MKITGSKRRFSLSCGKNGLVGTMLVLSWLGFPCFLTCGEPAFDQPAPPVSVIAIDDVLDSTGTSVPCSSFSRSGFYLFATDAGPQVAITPENGRAMGVLPPKSRLTFRLQAASGEHRLQLVHRGGATLNIRWRVNNAVQENALRPGQVLAWSPAGSENVASPFAAECSLENPDPNEQAAFFWQVSHTTASVSSNLPLISLKPGDPFLTPPRKLPDLHPLIENALVEWDWRLQDGLTGADVSCERYRSALAKTFRLGSRLIEEFSERGATGPKWENLVARWRELSQRWGILSEQETATDSLPEWEALYLQARWLKRNLAFSDPSLADKQVAFVKSAGSIFSHQLTQYTGNCARPGGGVYLLDQPGQSMTCRDLIGDRLPLGNFQFCDVSRDGQSILFSFCPVQVAPADREVHLDHFFHLWEVATDGSGLRQLTEGPWDDFAGKYLPSGELVFVSTRRGGFHRCGRGPCPVHTVTLANRDGTNPRVVSFHETQEWDPVPLWDGRILYTRWDYVDRNAVFYQQLWTVRSDGSFVQAYYGNNTFNPVGIWEARPIPGTNAVMATAAAHHAMTAGSIVRVDVTHGQEGLRPLTRLTPDALFPESEIPVPNRSGGRWFNPVNVAAPPTLPPEVQRFPGHCYKSPFPLSETTFLVAYSYDPLIGEPDAVPANMFGLYWMDVFGNKELLYRDLNISSLWPVAFQPPRTKPETQAGSQEGAQPGSQLPRRPVIFRASFLPAPQRAPNAEVSDHSEMIDRQEEGLFFLANVYQAWPQLPKEKIARLRIVQVLPKSTWHANDPTLGLPNISPGKQVLGTVPVEEDGSAFFRAPAKKALSFQALDARGRAVQIMRSVTYLQPGETVSCVGCHEPRNQTPRPGTFPLALRREPSQITPGPPGSRPFSYPLLVQPVLDRHCVSCHSPEKPEGNVVLTGTPAGRYTTSYHALARLVPYSDWAGRPGDFRQVNSEPTTQPDFFGARASRLSELLLNGHYGVQLTDEEWERLFTWMDCNVLFYGTFNPADQARQQRGEEIAGPDLE